MASKVRASEILPVPERMRIILAMLTKAANDHQPCPNNAVMAAAVGAGSSTAAANAVSALEVAGVITVVRGLNQRVVTINATGASTAGRVAHPIATYKRPRNEETFWTPERDGALMQRIADGADFEQAGVVCGCTGDMAAARFDELRDAMGSQAA